MKNALKVLSLLSAGLVLMDLPVPAVAHLLQGHYIALLRQEAGVGAGARIPGRAPLGHGEMRRLIAALGRQGNDAGEVELTHRALVNVAKKEEGGADCS